MSASTWDSWDSVASFLDQNPGESVDINKSDLPAPKTEGASRSMGLPKGQTSDWRFPSRQDGSGLHVQEFDQHWSAHIDRVHPAISIMGHLSEDAPKLHDALIFGAGVYLAWKAARAARKAKSK